MYQSNHPLSARMSFECVCARLNQKKGSRESDNFKDGDYILPSANSHE